MTVEETQQVLDRYLQALFGGGDFGQYLADDATLRFMDAPGDVTGRDAVMQVIVASHTEQFTASPQVTNSAVGAGTAAVEIVFTGTHTAEFAGIPATGVTVNVPYVAVYTMTNRRISEIRLYGLFSSLVAQITAGSEPNA